MNADPCTQSWTGISCSASKVTEVSLSGQNLVGTLPTELGVLTDLTNGLSLDSNELSGTLPTEFGNLVKLTRYLALGTNSLSGTLPTDCFEGTRRPRS